MSISKTNIIGIAFILTLPTTVFADGQCVDAEISGPEKLRGVNICWSDSKAFTEGAVQCFTKPGGNPGVVYPYKCVENKDTKRMEWGFKSNKPC